MQKALLAIIIVLVAVAGYWYLSIDEQLSEESNSAQTATYSKSELGLSFDYRPGPTGYVVEERTPAAAQDGLVRTIILTGSADYERMTNNPPVGGEGPPVIAINVVANTQKQFPLSWAQENVQYSNFNLKMGEETEAVVGGANAIRYMADGLYASDNVVVAHGDYMYVITGQYMDQNSDIRRDFQSVIDSVRFIPATAAAGKINIDAVCEGALAYMSFPDGAAAEKFVAECKEGKHPEVIEQYKAQMGLGDGAAI